MAREAKQLARKLELQQLRSEVGENGGSVLVMQLKEDKEQADGEKAMLAERSRLLQVRDVLNTYPLSFRLSHVSLSLSTT
jgi:hypothetical protein